MYRVTKTPSGIYAVDLGVDICDLNEEGLDNINALVADGEPVLIVNCLTEVYDIMGGEPILID